MIFRVELHYVSDEEPMPPQFYTADQTAPAQNLCRYQWLKPGANESCLESGDVFQYLRLHVPWLSNFEFRITIATPLHEIIFVQNGPAHRGTAHFVAHARGVVTAQADFARRRLHR